MSKNYSEHDVGLARRLYERLFFCPRGKHERSFSQVRPNGDSYVSNCRGCGVRMVRVAKRKWVIDSRA